MNFLYITEKQMTVLKIIRRNKGELKKPEAIYPCSFLLGNSLCGGNTIATITTNIFRKIG
jgi:hypothetical protein